MHKGQNPVHVFAYKLTTYNNIMMRLKNVVLLLFCSCCLMSQAQEPTDGYRPLVQEGKSRNVHKVPVPLCI